MIRKAHDVLKQGKMRASRTLSVLKKKQYKIIFLEKMLYQENEEADKNGRMIKIHTYNDFENQEINQGNINDFFDKITYWKI